MWKIVWEAAKALGRWAFKKGAKEGAKEIGEHAAKKGAQKAVKKMLEQAMRKGRKTFDKAWEKKKKGCKKCKPTDDLCKKAFGGGGTVTPGVYRGGAKGSIGSKKFKIEGHHIPSDHVNGMPYDKGPAIQMEYEDHVHGTASWGRGGAGYRDEQGYLLTNKGFMAAMTMDILQIKATHGSKYDNAIKEAVAYVACLDAVKAARGKSK